MRWNSARLGLLALLIAALQGCSGEPWDCGTDASCPALAEVNGVRYEVAVASELVGIEDDLSSFAPIGRTNVPGDFAELITFQIGALDPTAVLAAPAHAVRDEDVGPYRLLFGPNRSRAFPALCDYIPIDLRLGDERCGAPA